MRGKTFGPFVQRTSWGFAVALVLIAFPIVVQHLPTSRRPRPKSDSKPRKIVANF